MLTKVISDFSVLFFRRNKQPHSKHNALMSINLQLKLEKWKCILHMANTKAIIQEKKLTP